jgi:uncharacterized protein VirK/YbjX
MTGEIEEKISERDFITYLLIEDNIIVKIKYPKRSTLKKRYEVLDRLKTILRKSQ